MVPNTARIAHATCGNDDVAAVDALDHHALGNRLGGADALGAHGAAELVAIFEIIGVIQKNLGCADGKRRIEENRYVANALLRDERQKVGQQFLRALDGESRENQYAVLVQRRIDLVRQKIAARRNRHRCTFARTVGCFADQVVEIFR